MKMRLSGLITDSIVDGPGLRTVIFTQGCTHNCNGCHNPQTHDLFGGYEEDLDNLIDKINNIKLQKGITISGGEPFLQPTQLLYLILEIKKLNPNYDFWIYSGFTIEELLNKSNSNYQLNLDILKEIDVLVDGRFNMNLKDTTLLFRGSSNQRIIYLKEYFKNNMIGVG